MEHFLSKKQNDKLDFGLKCHREQTLWIKVAKIKLYGKVKI